MNYVVNYDKMQVTFDMVNFYSCRLGVLDILENNAFCRVRALPYILFKLMILKLRPSSILTNFPIDSHELRSLTDWKAYLLFPGNRYFYPMLLKFWYVIANDKLEFKFDIDEFQFAVHELWSLINLTGYVKSVPCNNLWTVQLMIFK